MYISLLKISKKKSPEGELASFLLGKVVNPKNEAVKTIIKDFNNSFNAFKADKEVAKMLSVAERYRNDGWNDGWNGGVLEGANNVVELIKSGLSPDEALRKVCENKSTLVDNNNATNALPGIKP